MTLVSPIRVYLSPVVGERDEFFFLEGSHLRGEPEAAAAMCLGSQVFQGPPCGAESEASPEKSGLKDGEELSPESDDWA